MKRPLRILMIVFNAVGKGTYWRAFHFARHLTRRGHHVTLLAMARTRRVRWHKRQQAGITIVESPDMLWGMLRSGWDLWEALGRCAWCSRQHVDIVHAFECRPTVLFPALYMQRMRHVPLVFDWGDWFGRGGSVEERTKPLVRGLLRPVETFFEERFRARADANVVICSTLQHKAETLGVSPATIALIRDGADTEGLRPLEHSASRAASGLPADAPLIGYVGAIFWRDAQLMARAFDRIHAARPEARLLLIGYVNMPVEQMVAAPQAVIRSGQLSYDALATHLAACDVCLLPLWDSGANRGRWPLKLFDYMAAGRPTVATAVGDVPDVMRAHDIGVLASATPASLAEATLALLADPARRAQQGAQARRAAEDIYTWQQRTDELEQVYRQAIAHQ